MIGREEPDAEAISRYAVVDAFGHGNNRGNLTVADSVHAERAAAVSAAARRGGSMVIVSSDGFARGQRIHWDAIPHVYPVVWQ